MSLKTDRSCGLTTNSTLQTGMLLWRQIEEYSTSSHRDEGLGYFPEFAGGQPVPKLPCSMSAPFSGGILATVGQLWPSDSALVNSRGRNRCLGAGLFKPDHSARLPSASGESSGVTISHRTILMI